MMCHLRFASRKIKLTLTECPVLCRVDKYQHNATATLMTPQTAHRVLNQIQGVSIDMQCNALSWSRVLDRHVLYTQYTMDFNLAYD